MTQNLTNLDRFRLFLLRTRSTKKQQYLSSTRRERTVCVGVIAKESPRFRRALYMDLSLNGGDLKVPLIGSHFDESSFSDEEVGPNRTSSREIRNRGAAAAGGSHGKHSIGFGALVFLIYYNIGVPFGDEEASYEVAKLGIAHP